MLKGKDFLDERKLYLASEKVIKRCENRFSEDLTHEAKMEIICEECDKMIDESGKIDTCGVIMYSSDAQNAFDYMYDCAVESLI